MSEAVNGVSTKVEPANSNHAGRNAAIAGGVGLIGGGTAGYMTKQIFKDDKFTDEFVKELKNQTILNAVKCSSDEYVAESKAFRDFVNLGDNPAAYKIKHFISKHRNTIEKLHYRIASLPETSADELLHKFSAIEGLFYEDSCGLSNCVSAIMGTYDKTKKKFNLTEAFEDPEDVKGVTKIVKKSIQSIKGKAGAIWGLTAGAVLGTGTYLISKLSGNKDA